MTDKDIVIIYTKQFCDSQEEYEIIEKHFKDMNEESTTKIIVVPFHIVEKAERL